VSGYPNEDNHGCWWLTTHTSWNRLHAIPGDDMTSEQMHEAIDWCEPIERRAVCGPVMGFTYPGLFSRFGMARCAHCCRVLGIPVGSGTPCNEKASKEKESAQ
jgi:hypothetical protein